MRYKRVVLSITALRTILGAGAHSYEVIQGHIPRDAKLVNVAHAWPNAFELLIESSEFEEVSEGSIIPELVPVLQAEQQLIA